MFVINVSLGTYVSIPAGSMKEDARVTSGKASTAYAELGKV